MVRRRRKRCSSRPSREEDVRRNVHDRRARFAGALGRRALLRKQTRHKGCLFFPLTGARRGHAAGARELRRALRTDAREPRGPHHVRRPSLDGVRTSDARALVERAAKSHQLVRLQTAAPLGPPRARGDAVPGAAHVRGGAHVAHGVHGDDARGARAVVVREVSRAGAGRETKLFGRRREKQRRRVVEKKQKKTRRRRRRARAAARAPGCAFRDGARDSRSVGTSGVSSVVEHN
mmetsp:Transcript_10064/g.42806  ORF Transcript_10064/g.42806 Transcript_10064/m.42806 type:complete len:234 (+) Transcript_10064:782-1483(+)